jgi:ATP-dependent helicase HrpB
MLAAAGISELDQFEWYEAPSKESLERAYGLLKDLGALDSSCEITALGRQMSRFPLHPRYARLLIEANRLGVMQDVALIAALSQGRPFYRASRDTRIRREQVRQIEDHADVRSDYFVHLQAWKIARRG